MPINDVLPFSLPVSDQQTAKGFYVDVLGLELVGEPDHGWLQVRPRGGHTSITLVTWFETMPPGSNRGTVLSTDDLDSEIDRLRGLGIVMSDVQEAPWGRFVTFDDPDGNGLVLQSNPT